MVFDCVSFIVGPRGEERERTYGIAVVHAYNCTKMENQTVDCSTRTFQTVEDEIFVLGS